MNDDVSYNSIPKPKIESQIAKNLKDLFIKYQGRLIDDELLHEMAKDVSEYMHHYDLDEYMKCFNLIIMIHKNKLIVKVFPRKEYLNKE